MLIEFSVTNFRSIKEEQTLSMLATNLKEHPNNVFQSPDPNIKLLKTAVIYGANASGKTNVAEAFGVFTKLITEIELPLLFQIQPYEPFQFDSVSENNPTTFEIEYFGKDQIRYNYKISYIKNAILHEALHYYPKLQKVKLFVRNRQEFSFGESLTGDKKNIARQVLPNQLFLKKAISNNNLKLKAIGLAMADVFIFTENDYNSIIHNTTENLYKNEDIQKIHSDLMAAFDSGITGYNINYDNGIKQVDNKTIGFSYNHFKVETRHKKYDKDGTFSEKDFPLEKESLGTQKLYGYGGRILLLMKLGISIIVDELNSSFHPLITEALIKLFHNREGNPKNAQLIFTTHDTSILDNEIFRRDQIWFTEKDGYGATMLFSLAQFDFKKVRKGIPFDKWYLSGRFGAIPFIDDFNLNTLDNEIKKAG
jgi:AAA15 family ATPase/GTPase